MTNNMTVRKNAMPVKQDRYQVIDTDVPRNYSAYDVSRVGKLMDEVVAAVKDDRANTKRAISADIASTARVQNQNERVIAACERELRRKDLTEERRDELLDRINRAAESTAVRIQKAGNISVSSWNVPTHCPGRSSRLWQWLQSAGSAELSF